MIHFCLKVLDDAYLLMQKCGYQMKVLMSTYYDMLRISEDQTLAQILIFSPLWSSALKKFLVMFVDNPISIIENKLEAAHYGQTHHVVDECASAKAKQIRTLEIVAQMLKQRKKVVIFASRPGL